MIRRPIQRRNPYPWIAFALVGLGFAALFVWSFRQDAAAPPVIAAPNVIAETVVVTATATSTPAETPTARIVVATATALPITPVPPCSQAAPGIVCRKTAGVVTPTAAPLCSEIPAWNTDALCRKDASDTDGRSATQ